MRRIACAAIVFALMAGTSEAQTPDREIVQIKGDLYRVRDGAQHTVFLATSEGIILGDPLTESTAAWLQLEFDKRFPEQLVRYIAVSTSLFNRIDGEGLFNDVALIVGSSQVEREMGRTRRVFPPVLAALDRDDSNTLSIEEVAGHPQQAMLMARDLNRDKILTPLELYSSVSSIERPYDRREVISLGGSRVELIQVRARGASELSVMFFPKERTVFAATIPGMLAAPARPTQHPAGATLAWVRAIGNLDFDTLLTGDGESLTRNEIVALRQYLEALYAGVASGYAAGESVEQVQTRVIADNFRTAPFYAGRRSHIAELFSGVRLVTGEIYGFASGRYVATDPDYCARYTGCEREDVVPLGTIGLRISGRTLGIAAEFSGGPQEMIARTSRVYDERIAVKDSRGSLLVRIASRPGGFSAALLGGLSATLSDARGEYISRSTIGPKGGRQPIASHERRYGATGGVEVTTRLSTSAGMLFTLRATRAISEHRGITPARDLDVRAGIGLSVRTHRHTGGPM